LFGLVFLGVDKLAANFVSTGVAFIFSFFVNKSFTFNSTTKNAKKQFILFLAITLFGLWIIQPVLINGTAWILNGSGLGKDTVLLIGKLIATLATLIWNYVLYSRFVFKKEA